jgi:hypothetical protein
MTFGTPVYRQVEWKAKPIILIISSKYNETTKTQPGTKNLVILPKSGSLTRHGQEPRTKNKEQGTRNKELGISLSCQKAAVSRDTAKN